MFLLGPRYLSAGRIATDAGWQPVIKVGSAKKGTGKEKSPQPQIRVRERKELRPGVDMSVDAADVGVCATTSGTEA